VILSVDSLASILLAFASHLTPIFAPFRAADPDRVIEAVHPVLAPLVEAVAPVFAAALPAVHPWGLGESKGRSENSSGGDEQARQEEAA
jgi:hypothetical protein